MGTEREKWSAPKITESRESSPDELIQNSDQGNFVGLEQTKKV
jgi:hypothetical protein